MESKEELWLAKERLRLLKKYKNRRRPVSMAKKRRVLEKILNVSRGSMKEVSDNFINEAFSKVFNKYGERNNHQM